jgi:hypothetical protein
LLDVLAGDLVAAGYAVGVDGEQDTHAVPGAGRDFGGRGAGGQPQRQRGMAQIVGAAHQLGACLARDGCGAGLVPDPAVEAFAERAAAGTPEQPPIFGAPESPQVQAQEEAATDATIGNRNSKPSTSPMATAESRTAVATPKLSRAMSVRYKTAPAAARMSAPAVRDAYPCAGVKPWPGRISHPASAEPATASAEAMSTGTVSTAALAKNHVSRRGTAISDSLIIPVLYSLPTASTPATATAA